MATNSRGRNEGSISQRGNGRWRAQLSTQNGKRVSASFATRSEAQKWLREQQSKLDHDYDFQGSKITLADYLPIWLNNSNDSLRPKTVYQYGQVIRKHILSYIGNFALRDLTLVQIEKFYSELLQAGRGVRTVRVAHNILHKALDKAIRYNLLIHNPTQGAALPRYHHTEMQVLDVAQVSQLLVAAQTSYYCALYYLAVTTGMRQGELFGLKWVDVNWNSGILHIQRQVQTISGQPKYFTEPKTRSGRRTIKLGEGTLQVLREHRELQNLHKEHMGARWHENDLIFPNAAGNPGDPSNLRIDFNETLSKAGLPRVRFHDLRHTAASLMLNHNIPVLVVSKILGHAKASTTLDIYGHLYVDMQDEAAQTMDRLVAPIKILLPQEVERKKVR